MLLPNPTFCLHSERFRIEIENPETVAILDPDSDTTRHHLAAY
jgi:hypothetical protein